VNETLIAPIYRSAVAVKMPPGQGIVLAKDIAIVRMDQAVPKVIGPIEQSTVAMTRKPNIVPIDQSTAKVKAGNPVDTESTRRTCRI
jgi:hypothetical protein